jgi:hypothetical protein
MSVLPFTFYNYVMELSDNEVEKFKKIFQNRLEKIPDKIVSSRVLMILLDIQSREEYDIFRNVYMGYFKKKVLGNII